MESNKILIGIEFHSENSKVWRLELIVLRDITLGQLLDGILYGLGRRCETLSQISDTPPETLEYYQECSGLYQSFKKDNFHEGEKKMRDPDAPLQGISITSYNGLKHPDVQDGSYLPLHFGDLYRTLDELGFVSSTRLLFHTKSVQTKEGIRSDNIIDAFKPLGEEDARQEKIYPEYNISDRQRVRFDRTPVEIIAPTEPPVRPQGQLLLMLMPTLLSVGCMAIMRGMFAGTSGLGFAMMSVGMGGVSIFTALSNRQMQTEQYETRFRNWKAQYESYVNRVMAKISERMKKDSETLNALYPDTKVLMNKIGTISPVIYSRSVQDQDFLTVRLGTSDQVESMFPIQSNVKDAVFSENSFELVKEEDGTHTIRLLVPAAKAPRFRMHLKKKSAESGEKLLERIRFYEETPPPEGVEDVNRYLCNLPAAVREEFKYLKEAPLLLSLRQCQSLGIVSKNEEPGQELVRRMLFELCCYHSPEQLQIVLLLPPKDTIGEQDKAIRSYKFLPHFRELFQSRSQFVFDHSSANETFTQLLRLMNERRSGSAEAGTLPHVLVVVFHEHRLKEHAFAQFLPQAPSKEQENAAPLGLSFIFLKKHREYLPAYCRNVITLGGSCYLTSHEDGSRSQSFTAESVGQKELEQYYRVLSSLTFPRISENGRIPSNVNLFGLYKLRQSPNGITVEKDMPVQELIMHHVLHFWSEEKGGRLHDVTKTLGVPIGETDSGTMILDLHEKADGPHMLVAGTTGSGKSETILSYLLGLCMYYRPDEIGLMLIDMKGGGFVKRIGSLPHVVGKITDVEGDENGTGAEYMLRRFLNALSSEIRRRKMLFNSLHVDNIDDYITACRSIDQHIDRLLRNKIVESFTEKEKAEIRRAAKDDRLPHLILVVDEFTELKRFSSESRDVNFMAEITTIARVGRSLGLHIILISQNIEGAITDDIRVNSRSKLCLKVATRQASKDMIGNSLAASPTMPGNGRAYLLVGTGSRFEYFQSAYSGASVQELDEMPVEMVLAEKNGAYSMFYESKKDNEELVKKEKEEAKDSATQLTFIVNAIRQAFVHEKFPEPHQVFRAPLPERVTLRDGKPYLLKSKELNRT